MIIISIIIIIVAAVIFIIIIIIFEGISWEGIRVCISQIKRFSLNVLG